MTRKTAHPVTIKQLSTVKTHIRAFSKWIITNWKTLESLSFWLPFSWRVTADRVNCADKIVKEFRLL